MTVQVMMTMPELPEGFEYKGEVRTGMAGDWVLNNCLEAELLVQDRRIPLAILRKIWTPPASAANGLTFYWSDKLSAWCITDCMDRAWTFEALASSIFADFEPPHEKKMYVIQNGKAVSQ